MTAGPPLPIQRIEAICQAANGRPVMPMPMVTGTAHLLLDPVLVQEVFTSRSFIRPEFFRRASGEGLLFAEGDRWKLSRSTLQPWFKAKQIGSLAPLVNRLVDELLTEWAAAADTGEARPIVADIAGLQFRFVGLGFLGTDFGPHDPRITTIIELTEAHNQLGGLGVFDPAARIAPQLVGQLRDGRAALDAMVMELVSARRNCPDETEPDLLDDLLSPAFLEPESGCPVVGEKGLKDELVLLYLASIGAATTSMGSAIELVMESPEARAGIRREAIDVANRDEPPQPSDMPWTLACFREALRLRPPVWFNGRVAVKRVVLSSGDVIEAGEHVHACAYLLHRLENTWPEPEAFKPERFLSGAHHEGPTYMPFGLGSHFCIGQPLTFLVGTTLLNRVIDRFDITFHSRTSHTPDGGFVLGPALGSTATFTHQCPESE